MTSDTDPRTLLLELIETKQRLMREIERSRLVITQATATIEALQPELSRLVPVLSAKGTDEQREDAG